MPQEEVYPKGAENKLREWLKGIPPWAYVVMAAAGIYIVYRFNQSSSSSTSGNSTGSNPNIDQGLLSSDLSGIPYDYMSGFPPGVTSQGTTSQGTPATFGPPTIPFPNTNNFRENNISENAKVRSRFSNPKYQGYDKNHSGVPNVSDVNTESSSGVIPFGSTVTIIGPPTTGKSSPSTGNNIYFPLQGGGFIAANDIASINSNSTPTGNIVAGQGGGGFTNMPYAMGVGGGGEGNLHSDWGTSNMTAHFDTSSIAHSLPLSDEEFS